MAYFLKKQNQNNRTYLAIYESFYSSESKGTKHRCFKSLGRVDKLIDSGISDPIAYYQKEVDKMNTEFRNNKVSKKQKEISDESPIRYLGYFPLARILNNLDVQIHFDLLQSTRDFQFNVYDVFTSLVFARAVAPYSKHKTFHDILPCLFKESNFSYDQLLSCIEFIGEEYEKFNEIFTVATHENYGVETDKTFFDCTNFYFEIDKEDGLKQKGPSKENRRDPIVGMGLLLDKNVIPIGMRLYPGNESEKPYIRSIIEDLKNQNNIKGRTIQVADKGLNCARNIHEAIKTNDGYIFSKSVKMLPQKEKVWVLLDQDYKDVLDEKGNVVYSYKSCVDTFLYSYKSDTGENIQFKVKEKRICTYNPALARKQKREIDRLVEKAKRACFSQLKKSEFGESSKYVDFKTEEGDSVIASINENKINKDRELAGYNMIVTSEIIMESKEIYDTYHRLWSIEQSFRIMKSELDARPVYLQKDDSIKGHFFICYICVLLTRLLEVKELKNRYPITQIFEFIRNYNVVQLNKTQYISLSKRTPVLEAIAKLTGSPITNYYLNKSQIEKMHTR